MNQGRNNGRRTPLSFAQGDILEEMPRCGCEKGCQSCETPRTGGFFMQNGVLAALYIPYQRFNELYTEDEAFKKGTLFRELDKPFCAGR